MRLALILLLTPLLLLAQNNPKFLYGKITDELGPLVNVHVINLKTKQATNTNLDGDFRILAQPNDSLKITSIGYKTQFFKLTIGDFGLSKKHIKLVKEVIELDEVELKKHNLIGSLSSDIKQVKHKKQIDAKSLGLPNAGRRKLTIAERRLFTAYGGGVLNIDVIINLLSGRIKKLKNLKRIEDKLKQEEYIKQVFTQYFVKELKIDSLDIPRFVDYCEGDKKYYLEKPKGEFSLIEFFSEKATEFKKLNEKP